MKLPSDLKPESVTAIIDSREQKPLELSPLNVEVSGLSTGDYSVRGLENIIAIERKSLDDAISCVGTQRDRFEREMMRLLAYPVRALVIESTWEEIEAGGWRGKVTPSQALGSLLGWISSGIPVIMAGNHDRAGKYVSRLLFTAARRRYRECRELVVNLDNEEK